MRRGGLLLVDVSTQVHVQFHPLATTLAGKHLEVLRVALRLSCGFKSSLSCGKDGYFCVCLRAIAMPRDWPAAMVGLFVFDLSAFFSFACNAQDLDLGRAAFSL
ncbi:hypothetical protein C405_05946 [Stenotrophomonas maltophilia AU12-09]|nr:hypothetical protein C405_05946 [Stenotrophomonas maltophilia AU12-09]